MAASFHFMSVLILALVLPAYSLPTQAFYNISVPIPTGRNATNHGSDRLFCVVPSPWTSIIVFYLGNYAAHAATVITHPGEAPFSILVAVFCALFFPASGVVRGLNAIARHWRRLLGESPTEVEKAARAGALCMVVRTTKWQPEKKGEKEETPKGETHHQDRPQILIMTEGSWCHERRRRWPFFETAMWRPEVDGRRDRKPLCEERLGGACVPAEESDSTENQLSLMGRLRRWLRTEKSIMATCELPSNGYYALAYVPRSAIVKPLLKDVELSHSEAKRAIIAIVQILFAFATLIKATRGPQIRQYGYTAFGLTVVPYLIMSFINLLGNLVAPVYESLYLVDSSVLREAERRFPLLNKASESQRKRFQHMVGKLKEYPVPKSESEGQVEEIYESAPEHEITRDKFSISKVRTEERVNSFDDDPNTPAGADEEGATITVSVDDHLARALRGKFNIPQANPSARPLGSRLLDMEELSLPINSSDTTEVKIPRRRLWRPDLPPLEYGIAFTHPRFKRRDDDKLPPTSISCPVQFSSGEVEPVSVSGSSIPPSAWGFFALITLFVSALSLLPMGLISGFRKGESTHGQRVWITCWIVFGFVVGLLAELLFRWRHGSPLKLALKVFLALVLAVPGIGGYFVVGRMLREYGNCTSLY